MKPKQALDILNGMYLAICADRQWTYTPEAEGVLRELVDKDRGVVPMYIPQQTYRDDHDDLVYVHPHCECGNCKWEIPLEEVGMWEYCPYCGYHIDTENLE